MSHASLILPKTGFFLHILCEFPQMIPEYLTNFPHLHERDADADPTHDANVVHNDVLQLAKAPAGVDDLGDLEKANSYPYKMYNAFN